MNNQDTYHDELTAHLAAQEQPLPHPKRYDHGYTVQDMRLRDFGLATQQPAKCCTGACNQGRQCVHPKRKHPGPITMHEPRADWLAIALVVAVTVLSVLAAIAHLSKAVPKP